MTGIDETLPEELQRILESGVEIERIRLDAEGRWTHQGEPFTNERLKALFSRCVDRSDGGTWILRIGRFTYPIEVDDAGFFVERIDVEVDPPLVVLSDGSSEPLAGVSYEGDGRLYCRVKAGRFRARFKRSAYYEVAEHVTEEDGAMVLELGGRTTRLS